MQYGIIKHKMSLFLEESMEKKLVIIDGSSLLYRAFYALPILSYNGIPTNAVMGFLNMLYDIYKKMDPEYVAVSFDKSKDTFRSELYTDYKSTRKPAPPELIPQFDLIREALRTLGAAVYEVAGYEGDDILGTLAAHYEKEMPVVIVTGDRDALQLSNEQTTVYITQKGVSRMAAMTPEAIFEKYHITPRQVIDMKALMGDTADNIPGVPGIGEKTALKLLTEYKTLDNLYAHVSEVKGAVGKKLVENKALAYLSYDLATIKKDVPFKFSLDEMKQPVHFSEMEEFFARLGLIRISDKYSSLPRFKELAAAKKEEIQTRSVKAEAFTKDISLEGKVAALALQYEGKSPFYKATCAVVACEGHAYSVLPNQFEECGKILKTAKEVVVENSKIIYESNFPFEGIPFYDMALVSYLLDPARTTYPLSYMAELFNVPAIFPDHLEQEDKGSCISEFLLMIYEKSLEKLENHHVTSLFREIEMPLVPVLAKMEKAGIATNREQWECIRKDMKAREKELLDEIYRESGEKFNVNSPKQLGHILFEKMGMPAGKKTKSGYSTAADVLEGLAESYPFVKNILEYRTLAKLISTYLDALPLLINKETGRIHTSFNQMVTATGRLSSSEPNLQNIPVRTDEGKKIRSLFVPGEGYDCFISSDYSQVELRILAHMSGDESLIRAFTEQEDIHRRTAAEILGIPFEEVTAEQRSHAKAVNFGIIYGISDFGLAKQLGISRIQAGEYIKRYFERYPSIHNFMEKMVEEAKSTGYAKTLFGRYRNLPDIKSSNFNRRSFAERTAMNTPIQGTAADIMKLAMIEVDRRMTAGNFKSRILLQVHDELVAEVIDEEKQEIKSLLKEAMESVVTLRVPLIADVHEGKNWAEAK